MFNAQYRFPSFHYPDKIKIISSDDLHKYEADYTITSPVCVYCDNDIPDGEYYMMFEGSPVCQDCEDQARAGQLKL